MKNKYVQLFLILSAFSLWAHKIPISTDTPFSSGEVLLSSENDTIAFSNGLNIFSCAFISSSTMESSTYSHAIGFQGSGGKMAYKKDPELTTIKYASPVDSLRKIGEGRFIRTIGNPDTNWSMSAKIPASTYPSDSLFIKTDTSVKSSRINGKMLFSHELSIDIMKCFEDLPFSNYNAILYFLPISHQSSNMKFQASSFIKDSVVYSLDCKQVFCDSIKIRWAIDSLGNGSFKSLTSIQNPAQNKNAPIIDKKSKLLNINTSDKTQSSNQSKLFNAQGRNFSKASYLKSKGIFFQQLP